MYMYRYVPSQENFTILQAPRGAHGTYAICWGRSPAAESDFSAPAGFLEVAEAMRFQSAYHLTSIMSSRDSLSVLAFQLGNSEAYVGVGVFFCH